MNDICGKFVNFNESGVTSICVLNQCLAEKLSELRKTENRLMMFCMERFTVYASSSVLRFLSITVLHGCGRNEPTELEAVLHRILEECFFQLWIGNICFSYRLLSRVAFVQNMWRPTRDCAVASLSSTTSREQPAGKYFVVFSVIGMKAAAGATFRQLKNRQNSRSYYLFIHVYASCQDRRRSVCRPETNVAFTTTLTVDVGLR